jgi:hypothetical protein
LDGRGLPSHLDQVFEVAPQPLEWRLTRVAKNLPTMLRFERDVALNHCSRELLLTEEVVIKRALGYSG